MRAPRTVAGRSFRWHARLVARRRLAAARVHRSAQGAKAESQRGAERAADELAVEPRRRAGDRQHLVVAQQVRRGARTACACRGAAGRGRVVDIGAHLDDLAGVHHRGPVADLRDHRQVVGDQDQRQARGRASGRTSSSRIWACTITSSAVVGSSASSTFGWQASAMRDRRALAHAARELVRVAVGALAGDADQLQQLAHLRLRAALPAAVPCSSIGSTIWSPTRLAPG